MSGFNQIQSGLAQSIQTALTNQAGPAQTPQAPAQTNSAPLGADAAMLSSGGPSYMQTIEALMVSQMAANAQSGNLGNLQALLGTSQARTSSREGDSDRLATNYGRDNNFGVFNPTFYSPSGVGSRGGNGGGYGNGGRTGAGNVATSGIDRMIEMMVAQSLGRPASAPNMPRFNLDAVTLVGRSSDDKTNAFQELTGGLIELLAEQLNAAGDKAMPASPSFKRLMSEIQEQRQDPSYESLNQSQFQALMDEVAVMQLIQATRTNGSAAPANTMVGTIMDVMQNLLGAQNGGSVSASQMQSLLGALMNNLKSGDGGASSPAAAMMQQMLPEMMAMLDTNAAPVPGAIASKSANDTLRVAPFKASINSKGEANGLLHGGAAKNFQVQAGQNGGITILDGSKNPDIAGGFGIGASVGQNGNGDQAIQAGTFSWNSGQDAVALNAQGQAAVTSDGGRTWAPLPAQGISTYNPGNGGPTLTYDPDGKTVSFQASGKNNDQISAVMQAGNDGVDFSNIEGTNGVNASGQLAAALS